MLGFWKNKNGNVAVIFALALIPITIVVGASVDISRMRSERTQLQAAVDAAVLAAAKLPLNSTDAVIERTIDDYLAANYNGNGAIAQRVITRDANGAIQIDAIANVPMTFATLLGADERPVSALAAAERGGVNLEMALVLDVTGSMQWDLGDLQAAARTLVNAVVQDVQTPYYSKASIIPYSAAVNLGNLADEARGDPTAPKLITDYSNDNTADGFDIEDITRERPTEVETYDNHGLSDNDLVKIVGVKGMTNLNDRVFKVDRRAAKKVDLYDFWGNKIDSRYWSAYQSGGVMYKCDNWWCEIGEDSFVSANHGFSDGDLVVVEDVSGMWWVNGGPYAVDRVSADRLNFEGADTSGTYSGGGKIQCTDYGCKYLYFWDPPSGWWGTQDDHTWELTQCVSERTGDEAYTDAAPSIAPVGMVYASSASGGECPATEIVPLTANRASLIGTINGLTTGGATAGQIGIAWGWYTLSPNFNEMWTSSQDAAAYDAPQTLKVAVIMTDGEFNTAYCNGVQAKNYGGDIDCNATNGDPFDQAEALCDGMKAAGIRIYTVAYDVAEDSDEAAFMDYCASGDENSFLASNGQALQSAFAQIGDSIGQLRLTR